MAVGEVAHSGGGGCSGVRQEKRRSNSNNALAFAEQFKRSLGHGLYEQNLIREQVAQLTSDMVLLVENSVILPDGTTTSSSSVIASAARQSSNSFSNTSIDRVAGLYVKGSAGALLASAGRDLNLKAAEVSNAGTGDSQLSAGNNLNLGTVTTASSQSLNWDANNHLRQSSSQDVGSQIKAGGNLTLKADQDINAKAAQVSAGQALKATAGNSVNITAGQASETFDEARKSTNKGFLSSTTTNTQIKSASTTAQGSSFEGNSVNITAGKDQNIKGSSVLADQSVNLSAGGNVNITAAQNTSTSSNFNQTTKSGLFGGGGLSVTLGKQTQSVDSQGQGNTAAGSTVGSTGGNVSITAAQTYTQTGSDVITPKGDIDITAKTVDIQETRETGSQSTEQKFKQSGLTLAITSPVLSALQTANNQLQAAGNTSSGRMQALAAANAGFNLKQGADAVQAGQGDANGMVKNADGKMVEGNAADKAGGIGISLSLGASSSQSQQQSSADSAKGSKVNAGGNVTITATGAGKDSDITVQGSNVTAGKATTLKADDQVNLLAAQNTTQESSNSKNSSGSIGVGFQLGAGGAQAGVTVSASAGKGQGAGNSTTFANSQVAGNTVNIESGGDTTIKGGVVRADQVTAKVGGNLNIESLQDKSQYNEKSQSVGGSVTFGPAAGGSVNVGKTKINSDYQSVGEQSAIRAGDGGFNVNVAGKTNLTGGQITSTQAAVDAGKNSYKAKEGTTTTDLNNSAKYSANSVSVGLGAGAPAPGAALSTSMSGVGFGSDKGSASSTTTAGISGVVGNTTARTGDKSTSIAPIFNKDQVQKDVAAQVAITSEFGKQASKAVGDYAATKLAEAKKNNDQAGIDAWKEGGTSRVALHAVVGGLTGGVQGAVGAGTSQAVIDQVGQVLKETNLPTELKQALVLAAGTAVGAAASGGSVAGGATAFNATANNYLTTVDLSKANRTKSLDIKTSLANNDKLIDACQGGPSAACTQAQTKVQQDIQNLQDYKIALLSERNLSNDSATKEAISARIKEADAQIASANNQLETARLQTNGGNYFTKDLTGAQRETIGMALDPLQAAGVKAGVKVVNTVTTVIDNAVVSAEQATSVNKTKVELNGVSENVAAKLPTAADATATSPYSSNGTIYGKTTLTDVNGNPIATKPILPSAGANGGVIQAVDGAIPNAGKAVIDPNKLTSYALNPLHPVGGDKARVFESALGYNQSNADQLIGKIQQGALTNPAVMGKADQFGQRFTVDMPITGPNGNTVVVRTGWVLDPGATIPRLATAYVK